MSIVPSSSFNTPPPIIRQSEKKGEESKTNKITDQSLGVLGAHPKSAKDLLTRRISASGSDEEGNPAAGILHSPKRQKKEIPLENLVQVHAGIEIDRATFEKLKEKCTTFAEMVADLGTKFDANAKQYTIPFPFDQKKFDRIIDFLENSASLEGDAKTLISDFKAGDFLGFQEYQVAALAALLALGNASVLKLFSKVGIEELTNVIKPPVYSPGTAEWRLLRNFFLHYRGEGEISFDLHRVYVELYKLGVFNDDALTSLVLTSEGGAALVNRLVFDGPLLLATLPELPEAASLQEQFGPIMYLTGWIYNFLVHCHTFPTIRELVFDRCFSYDDAPNATEMEVEALEGSKWSLEHLKDMPNLEKIALIGPGLDDLDIDFIETLPRLKNLRMHLWEISANRVFALLQNLPNLESLDLSFFNGAFRPEFFKEASRLVNLTHLACSINLGEVEVASSTLVDVASLEKMIALETLTIETVASDELKCYFTAVAQALIDLKEKRNDLAISYNGKSVSKGCLDDFLRGIDESLIFDASDESNDISFGEGLVFMDNDGNII